MISLGVKVHRGPGAQFVWPLSWKSPGRGSLRRFIYLKGSDTYWGKGGREREEGDLL